MTPPDGWTYDAWEAQRELSDEDVRLIRAVAARMIHVRRAWERPGPAQGRGRERSTDLSPADLLDAEGVDPVRQTLILAGATLLVHDRHGRPRMRWDKR
jgi:hypothetical protein